MNKALVFLKKMSISKRLILYITILLLVQMSGTGIFSYKWTYEYLTDTHLKKIRETNYTIMQQSNFIRNKYEDISDKFLSNTTIQKLLLENLNSQSQIRLFQNKTIIDDLLTEPNEKTNTIITADNRMIYQSLSGKYNSVTYDRVKNSEIFKNFQHGDGRNFWFSSNQNIVTDEKAPYLYLYRNYLSVRVMYKSLGQLIIQIPVNELSQIFKESDLDDKEYYAIISNNGKYIYHTGNMNLMGQNVEKEFISKLNTAVDGYQMITIEKEDFLFFYSISGNNGWNIIHLVPMEAISSSARKASNYILLIMLISLLLSLPLLILILKSFTKPIKALKTTLELFGNGNTAIRAKADRMDEIGLLQNSFNKMAEDINNHLQKIDEDNKQKRLMELNILEYQINPHFLYNSLDFINWTAHKSGVEEISEMVTALARFFRVGLSKGKEFYTVKDELDHVKQYLLINKLRFKDCFQFDILAEPEVLKYSTIKIILQPAVENAIKHGVNKYSTTGFIRVSAKKDEDSIIFEVSDNGVGIEPDRLAAIQKILKNHEQDDMNFESGFGLYNVNLRIWMQYGEGYGVSLESSGKTGTLVKIRLPAFTT